MTCGNRMRSASYIAAKKEKSVTFDNHIYSWENKRTEREREKKDREEYARVTVARLGVY